MLMRAVAYSRPPEAPPPAPVRFPDLRGEWRIGREALRLALSAPALRRHPRGNGEPVVLIPGWQAPEASMAPLRRHLLRQGFDARHWGLGRNLGDVEGYLDVLLPKIAAIADRTGEAVGLVGWSLGGVIAREIARELPDRVRCVATYGSPVVGGPTYTVGAARYGQEECERIETLADRRARENPIAVPVASIFSRLDSIVSWPACIDRISPKVTHYEVRSTHLSMGIDPTVWRIVIETLLAPGCGR
jgi:pimeloyl-ACP methyl ester carboxylesterase